MKVRSLEFEDNYFYGETTSETHYQSSIEYRISPEIIYDEYTTDPDGNEYVSREMRRRTRFYIYDLPTWADDIYIRFISSEDARYITVSSCDCDPENINYEYNGEPQLYPTNYTIKDLGNDLYELHIYKYNGSYPVICLYDTNYFTTSYYQEIEEIVQNYSVFIDNIYLYKYNNYGSSSLDVIFRREGIPISEGWFDTNIGVSATIDNTKTSTYAVIPTWYKGTGRPPTTFVGADETSIDPKIKNVVSGSSSAYNNTYYKYKVDLSFLCPELAQYINSEKSYDLYPGIVNGGKRFLKYYNGTILRWAFINNAWTQSSSFVPPNNDMAWVYALLNSATFNSLKNVGFVDEAICVPDLNYADKSRCEFGVWGQDDNFFPNETGYVYLNAKKVINWTSQKIGPYDGADQLRLKCSKIFNRNAERQFYVYIGIWYSDDGETYTEYSGPISSYKESVDEMTDYVYLNISDEHKYWKFEIRPPEWVIIYNVSYHIPIGYSEGKILFLLKTVI